MSKHYPVTANAKYPAFFNLNVELNGYGGLSVSTPDNRYHEDYDKVTTKKQILDAVKDYLDANFDEV